MTAGKWEQLLYKIRVLDAEELRAIRRWNEDSAWCNINSLAESGGTTSFTRSIRDSARTAIEKDEFSYEDFVQYLRAVQAAVTSTLETHLKDIVQRPVITKLASSDSVKQELWASAQLYGYLQRDFTPLDAQGIDIPETLVFPEYRVYREHTVYGYSLDLLIEDQTRGGRYLIEVKQASSLENTKSQTVIDQVNRYNDLLDDRKHTLVPVFYEYERELSGLASPQGNTELGDFEGSTKKTLENRIESECSDTKCVFCKLGP